MIDFVDVIRSRTADMAVVLDDLDPATRIRTCPGWSAADLGYHLFEVQTYWTAIAEGVDDIGEEWEPHRPARNDLPDALVAASLRLCAAIEAADPSEPLETWAGPQPPSWLARRQAHEVLIHGADATIAAGGTPEIGTDLGRDGVEEVLEWHHGPAPEWADWEPTAAIALVQADGPGRWRMEWGRLQGSSPASGVDYDLEMAAAAVEGPTSATVEASAGVLDLWLWRRADVDAVSVTGDIDLVERIFEGLAID